MVWTGSSVVFRFRIVRGFCFVKYDASGVSVWDEGGEIPAFAGMTWEGVGMTCEGVGMTWVGAGEWCRHRGNDVDRGS